MENLLTIEDVAEKLNCTTRHIQNLVKRGEFPAPIKLGVLVRWREATVEEHLTSLESPAA